MPSGVFTNQFQQPAEPAQSGVVVMTEARISAMMAELKEMLQPIREFAEHHLAQIRGEQVVPVPAPAPLVPVPGEDNAVMSEPASVPNPMARQPVMAHPELDMAHPNPAAADAAVAHPELTEADPVTHPEQNSDAPEPVFEHEPEPSTAMPLPEHMG